MNNATSQANRLWESLPKHSPLAHRLRAVVREHGFPCRILPNGDLKVASLAVTFTHGASTGPTRWYVQTIPATSAAVYEWLGY